MGHAGLRAEGVGGLEVRGGDRRPRRRDWRAGMWRARRRSGCGAGRLVQLREVGAEGRREMRGDEAVGLAVGAAHVTCAVFMSAEMRAPMEDGPAGSEQVPDREASERDIHAVHAHARPRCEARARANAEGLAPITSRQETGPGRFAAGLARGRLVRLSGALRRGNVRRCGRSDWCCRRARLTTTCRRA